MKTTINACVFPLESIECFSDVDVDSTVKMFSILIKKSDWVFKNKTIKIGDIVFHNNIKTKVIDVIDE